MEEEKKEAAVNLSEKELEFVHAAARSVDLNDPMAIAQFGQDAIRQSAEAEKELREFDWNPFDPIQEALEELMEDLQEFEKKDTEVYNKVLGIRHAVKVLQNQKDQLSETMSDLTGHSDEWNDSCDP
jgi:uncharacterized protein YaaN involved in tellurite resistance